jgi:hypothetical protein
MTEKRINNWHIFWLVAADNFRNVADVCGECSYLLPWRHVQEDYRLYAPK